MQTQLQNLEQGVLLVRVQGSLDTAAADRFFKDVSQGIEPGVRHIIVDCQGIDLVASMGLAAMMRLHARMAQEGGSVKLAGLEGMVAQVVELMNLDRVVQVCATVAQAQQAIQNQESSH